MPDQKPTPQPPQRQDHQPGTEAEMNPQPQDRMEHWKPSGKLAGKTALVTGGDSGIGRAVAIGFAKEGADVAMLYLNEHDDAARDPAPCRGGGAPLPDHRRRHRRRRLLRAARWSRRSNASGGSTSW